MNILWWVRRDLRLADNPVLEYAKRTGAHVLPVYIHAPDEESPWQPGAANNWWRAQSLTALQQRLQAQAGQLIIRRGPSAQTLVDLAQEHAAEEVVWNRLYEPGIAARDHQVASTLVAEGLQPRHFPGHLLIEPKRGTKANGEPYRVFTPFWKNAQTLIPRSSTTSNPPRTQWINTTAASDSLDAFAEFRSHRWQRPLASCWNPGESSAQETLHDFVTDRLAGYSKRRDELNHNGTSQLSPHLHFGEISVQRVWSSVGTATHDSSKFRAELGWREFAHHVLWHYPNTPTDNFNPRFNRYPWRVPANNDVELRAWQRGETGIEVIDAAMNQLWKTGWMHNRARMLVGSLLTKNLGIHWHSGARWFWNTLVDADLANNSLGWQWVAGCGVDAAPFFRIFNPDTQAERYDPQHDYRRRWLDEPIRNTLPIVDLKLSRARALDAYKDNCTGND